MMAGRPCAVRVCWWWACGGARHGLGRSGRLEASECFGVSVLRAEGWGLGSVGTVEGEEFYMMAGWPGAVRGCSRWARGGVRHGLGRSERLEAFECFEIPCFALGNGPT
ncbi:hypothetical protein JCM16814_00240 [Desulfobaculum senezii]